MKNFWKKLPKNFFVLAPMAGITDQPFRLMCKKFGVDVVCSEMISSEALFHNASNIKFQISNFKNNESQMRQLEKTLRLIQFSEVERPYVVQIFGNNPEHMAFAAKYISSGNWFRALMQISNIKMQNENVKFKNYGIENSLKIKNLSADRQDCELKIESIPDGIDINMGCPAKDVVKTGAGAALIKNQDLAIKIVKAIKKEVKNIPISVKTRLGWSNHDEILVFSKKLEAAGINALAIHGRTYKEGFAGEVDWKMIEKVKKQLKIPVIGNGDLCHSRLDPESQKILKQVQDDEGINGYMIGQGALGKPWIFDEIKNLISNCKLQKSNINGLKKIILEHARLVEELKGERGIQDFRKHLLWYVKGNKNAAEIRKNIASVNKYANVKEILKYL